jgi:hypothetical protein
MHFFPKIRKKKLFFGKISVNLSPFSPYKQKHPLQLKNVAKQKTWNVLIYTRWKMLGHAFEDSL